MGADRLRGMEEQEKSAGPGLISIEEFAEVQLRAGRVVAAEAHPNADKLMVLKVDVGEEAPRQLVAGISSDYEPEELTGRTIIVVANLKPARLRGVESQGMLLAATPEGGKPILATFETEVP